MSKVTAEIAGFVLSALKLVAPSLTSRQAFGIAVRQSIVQVKNDEACILCGLRREGFGIRLPTSSKTDLRYLR